MGIVSHASWSTGRARDRRNKLSDDDDVGVNALYVTGSIVYHFREAGRILPFVMAGGRVTTLDIDGGDTQTGVTGVFGAGVLTRQTMCTQWTV